MHITTRNVNTAFNTLVGGIADGSIPTVKSTSRVGKVLQIVEPIIIKFERPRERVLLNDTRDCNPFFQLYESMWMLAGRNDVAPLEYYSSQIGKIASNDGKTIPGAYGHRWRKASKYEAADTSCNPKLTEVQTDQLNVIIEHLRNKPESRRAVLQMWTVKDDLMTLDTSKDVCCNTAAYFSIRSEYDGDFHPRINKLDMTVCNRSNDLVWGLLGANIVHFSLLQEYMANCLGVEVGVYNQFSNNLHVYTATNGGFKPAEWLADGLFYRYKTGVYPNYPGSKNITLVSNKEVFDKEVQEFVELNKDYKKVTHSTKWQEPFLDRIAQPMMHAFHMHKQRDYFAARQWLDLIENDAWQKAADAWIYKRRTNWEAKNNPEQVTEGVDL